MEKQSTSRAPPKPEQQQSFFPQLVFKSSKLIPETGSIKFYERAPANPVPRNPIS